MYDRLAISSVTDRGYGIIKFQNADSAFVAPQLVTVTSYYDEAVLKPAL